MENLTFDINELVSELMDRARAQGALSREAYGGLAEAVIEEKRGVGEIDADQNREMMLERLRASYDDFMKSVDVM